MICGCQNGFVFALDLNTKARFLSEDKPHTAPVRGLMMMGSYIVSCGEDGMVKMWNPGTSSIQCLKELRIEQQTMGAQCTSIAFIPEKNHIICGCSTGYMTCWQILPNIQDSHFLGNMGV